MSWEQIAWGIGRHTGIGRESHEAIRSAKDAYLPTRNLDLAAITYAVSVRVVPFVAPNERLVQGDTERVVRIARGPNIEVIGLRRTVLEAGFVRNPHLVLAAGIRGVIVALGGGIAALVHDI